MRAAGLCRTPEKFVNWRFADLKKKTGRFSICGFEVCGLKKRFVWPTFAKQLHPYTTIDYFMANTVLTVPGAT